MFLPKIFPLSGSIPTFLLFFLPERVEFPLVDHIKLFLLILFFHFLLISSIIGHLFIILKNIIKDVFPNALNFDLYMIIESHLFVNSTILNLFVYRYELIKFNKIDKISKRGYKRWWGLLELVKNKGEEMCEEVIIERLFEVLGVFCLDLES